MQVLPVDLVSLVATVLGISIVLIPVLGFTARFALNPAVEALSRLFDARSSDESMRLLERRLELQEQEIAMLQQSLRALTDAQDFDRRLRAPTSEGPGDPPLG